MNILEQIARELNLKPAQVEAAVKLLDEGNTIPFIARYRKEVTGSLDDQVLRELADRLQYLRNLEKRKEEIISSIAAQEKLTDELEAQIRAAVTLAEAEDLYRPYKPKRKTRASVARARGLEPLAERIRAQEPGILAEAEAFLTDEVPTAEDALQGAMDIIAEEISDDAALRAKIRPWLNRTGAIASVAADPETDTVYRMYYDFAEPVGKIASHRILALDRGEREGVLKISLKIDRAVALRSIENMFVRPSGGADQAYDSDPDHGTYYLSRACTDSFDRLLFPSLEREVRAELTARAAEAAIRVFGQNLRPLLMQPPVKGKVVLGLDPGFRTGCKLAVVDATGKVLDHNVLYLHQEDNAKQLLARLIRKWDVAAVAIGNGTAGRESEALTAAVLRDFPDCKYMIVNEAGASVYSASKLGAKEFPQFDVTVRGAISIARRLQDPLAELVKIDPQSIGVGQYQHDMPKARLAETLDGVVESCVNNVGVDLNTASAPLLARVAGIGAAVAENIVAHREDIGSFEERKQLLKVKKLGPKAYEQCAGFLRIPGGKNPLDNTGVHPESYPAVKTLQKTFDLKNPLDIPAVVTAHALQSPDNRAALPAWSVAGGCGSNGGNESPHSPAPDITASSGAAMSAHIVALAEELQIGEPTLRDILKELQKPGRDPRDELPPPLLRSDVLSVNDLKPGMELIGTVRNAVDFGVFVDIGVHEDGLVHISRLGAKRFIKHPLEVVSVGDTVKVWVLDIDAKRKRIALTMDNEQRTENREP